MKFPHYFSPRQKICKNGLFILTFSALFSYLKGEVIKMVKIYLDPGHGGSDPGARGNGLVEKDLNLAIALQIRSMLLNEYEGATIRMSRTNDRTVSLSQRTSDANAWGADFFLSIHINASGGSGFESYIYPGTGSPTTTYQNIIHSEILKQVDLRDRGKKRANFHVLRETRMPALLTENGFIDHPADAAKLKNPQFIQALARGHVNGIVKAFGLRKKAGNSGPGGEPGKLYRVQIGAYKQKANAEAMAKEARNKGFQTYIFHQDGLYKVQIGAFQERKNAEALADRAKKAGFQVYINYS